MSSASLFEQLASSVSLSMLAIVSVSILALLLLYTIAGRVFFSSSKPKPSASNHQSSKDKKLKEANVQKKQQVDVAPANKKKTNKSKKPATIPVAAAPSSSSTGPSDESDNEKVVLAAPSKKAALPTKSKKPAAVDEIKSVSNKQQAVNAPVENSEGQHAATKSKQPKSATTLSLVANTQSTNNKQKPTGKRDVPNKVNNTVSKKNESGNTNIEYKRIPIVDTEVAQDQEDEGQWLTQGSKQVNQRNRNKGKIEQTYVVNQIPPVVVEQKPIPVAVNPSVPALVINTDFNAVEPAAPANPTLEPIEINQLLPRNKDLYTSNDNWWKNPLNKQPTFSIDDIGEWPECEPDEQYTVQVKQIIPKQKATADEL